MTAGNAPDNDAGPVSHGAGSVHVPQVIIDQPILADYLAMGAGDAVALDTETPQPSQTFSLSATIPEDAPVRHLREELAIRDRRLVAAALKPAEVLQPKVLPTPDGVQRVATRVQRMSVAMPDTFEKAYQAYVEKQQKEEEAQERAASRLNIAQMASVDPRILAARDRKLLRGPIVQPRQRDVLMHRLCKNIRYRYIEYRREQRGFEVLQTESTDAPKVLESNEIMEMNKHVNRGDTQQLVRLLVACDQPKDGTMDLRRLFLRIDKRNLDVDAVLELFLDGALTWPALKQLWFRSPLVPKAS